MKRIHTYVVLAYKESEYLEECIKSVLHQEYKSNVVIATSTPNAFISNIAKKYKLKIITNKSKKGIGYDFDFAITCSKTPLVTIAHQDDIYDYSYSYEMVKSYIKNKKSLILFSNYYEVRNNEKVYKNTNLNIKKILLFPARINFLMNFKFAKRLLIRFGNAISCPAVTFVVENVPCGHIFESDYKCDVDWQAWEKLSKHKGKFIYVNKALMGHRVHDGSTTTKIIQDNIRTKEDFDMLKKFWPTPIAKFINKFYIKSQKSNNV